MIYKFRVTLPGIKGFYRIYKVNSANTFYSFHKELQSDLEFPTDQPILFKALDQDGGVVARYALVDLGFGTVDDVTIEKAVKAGAASFIYFYDTKAKKNVIVTLEAELPGNDILVPTLMDDDIKGPNPAAFENGYVAFEDLPQEKRRLPGERNILDLLTGDDGDEDDEDEDEDDENKDEEGDDEDGKEIYDENEA